MFSLERTFYVLWGTRLLPSRVQWPVSIISVASLVRMFFLVTLSTEFPHVKLYLTLTSSTCRFLFVNEISYHTSITPVWAWALLIRWVIGALSTIWSGDKLGRPRTILLGSSTIALGAIIQTAAYGVPQMIVGRIVAGLGTGMNTATAGVWQAETSKMRSRGKLVIIQMANCITGFSISNWLTLGFSFTKGSVAWRFPLAFQICMASTSRIGRAH